MPEDHIGALCEIMRHLIAESDSGLDQQQQFFRRWITPAAAPLCNAIEKSAGTSFYKLVARFSQTFFELEQAAFEMR